MNEASLKGIDLKEEVKRVSLEFTRFTLRVAAEYDALSTAELVRLITESKALFESQTAKGAHDFNHILVPLYISGAATFVLEKRGVKISFGRSDQAVASTSTKAAADKKEVA